MVKKTLDIEHDCVCGSPPGNVDSSAWGRSQTPPPGWERHPPYLEAKGKEDPVRMILEILQGHPLDIQNQIIIDFLGKFQAERMNSQNMQEEKLEALKEANKLFDQLRGR